MKALRNLLDKVKPNFEKGGKFEKLLPLFDGIETFLFVPGHTTHSGTHIRDGIDLKRTMITVVFALIPCLLFGMWNVGYQYHLGSGIADASFIDNFIFGAIRVLPIIIVSYGVGLGIEFGFAIVKKHSVNEGYLVSGMLIPLILPVDIPLWMVAVATIFAVVIGKEVFGGTGMNILNVALAARAFLFFAYPTKMSGNDVWFADAVSGATPLAAAIEGGVAAIPSIADSFWGYIPGSIGETSAAACLIGAFILLFTGVASWRIMVSVFVGGLVMGMIFNVFAVNPLMAVPAMHHIMLGGFMFGLVFMATDPVTASQTNTGKYIYGFFIGIFAIMIRVFNPAFPEGMMLAILFMNVMAPLIDHYVVQANINRRLKRISIKA
ncbi:MAG: NADH:ubiquinone reductase (Na(+)-transporting) subunit B [Bacteroidetes bacterium]|nr:NADH:ubiquinone reductase (Na(+)-transporting) subunit B [Bacteroidota bacterium]HET6245963.1 NADH:ubiquinone reductase (Na(+)-transporting) subunit B [Bacteroidia bacterium]